MNNTSSNISIRSGDGAKCKKLYTIEFLRIIFILGIVFGHIGQVIHPKLQEIFLNFFHTKYHKLWFGVEGFFIIAGFFLYRSISAHKGTAFMLIEKLWVRLVPAMIFAVVILSSMGIVPWWKILDVSYFLPGTGLSPEVIWNSEWFICVYFLISCLMIGLFNYSEKLAWLIVGIMAYVALSLLLHARPVRNYGVIDGMYYTLVSYGTCRGIVCISLGMIASFISDNLFLPKGRLFRIVATCLELITLYILFSYMLRTSLVHFTGLEVELGFTFLMISISHGWGYISAVLNRMSWIQLFSRYTYPFLIGHAIMIKFFRSSHISLEPNYKSIMITGGVYC